MYEIYENSSEPEKQPALVLVDEIDAHMHPEWQQMLVPLLRKKFPLLQVIATTHSPLVVGNMEPNEVYHFGRDPELGQIKAERLKTSFDGWRADQILTSSAFNLQSSASLRDETVRMINEYSQLLGQNSRNDTEEKRLSELSIRLDGVIPRPASTQEGREASQILEELLMDRLRSQPPERRERILKEAQTYIADMELGRRSK
jgi:hypothetical protein